MSTDRKSFNPRTFVPSQSTGVDGRDNKLTAGEASKDSLTGKNTVTEYKTGKPARGSGPDGGMASR
jgi:hypothetical protein